jgi:quercetin dioxygenase-like cupin family protein
VETTTRAQPVVLTAEEIAALPVIGLGPIAGVTHRVLWRTEASMAGLMTVEAGKHLGMHAHQTNHHHIWIVEGSATVLGEQVGPGSYVHVPSGVDHDVDATDTDGCTFLYLYLHPTD